MIMSNIPLATSKPLKALSHPIGLRFACACSEPVVVVVDLVMKMTFPILTPVTNVSTMIFILPVANPPAPTSPKVTVDRLPAMEVYAK